jgi:hypothetical protein
VAAPRSKVRAVLGVTVDGGGMSVFSAAHFDFAECNRERERGFVEAFHARAEAGGWFGESWP